VSSRVVQPFIKYLSALTVPTSDQIAYRFGPFRLEEAEVRLLREKEIVRLKPKVFQLLLIFIRNAGHMLTKEQLMDELWPNAFVEEHNLAVHISDLRKALGEDYPFVQTVARHGYRFTATVERSRHKALNQLIDSAEFQYDDGPSKNKQNGLAVLPFKNNGPGPKHDYLGLGLADALISKLSALKGIAVRPTSSVRRYVATGNPATAGRELQVDLVLEGGFQRVGRRVRITVQLVSISSDATLWADKYDEEFSDILQLQDSISEQVAQALALELTLDEKRSLTKGHTRNVAAFVAYMKGLFLLNKRLIPDLNRSIEYYREAINLDPNYALAYVGVGRALVSSFSLGLLAPHDALEQAKRVISQALAIDNDLAEAHAAMGQLRLLHDWDWVEAERELQQAINLGPNCSLAHENYALYLTLAGRFDEALEQNYAAQMLDPASLAINLTTARIHYVARDFDGALAELAKVLELEANYPAPYYFLGLIYDQLKEYEKAEAAYKQYRRLHEDNPEILANLCRSYALAGKLDEALHLFEQIRASAALKYVPPYYIAICFLGLGNVEESLAWLEKAHSQRDANILGVKVDLRLDKLRTEPQFLLLSERVFSTSPRTDKRSA
jgi:TolB-like protein/Flp pilus assembly protein TadD